MISFVPLRVLSIRCLLAATRDRTIIIGNRATRVKLRGLARFATITLFFNSLGEFLYLHLERRLAQHVREFLRRTYDLDLPKIVIEQPPKVEFGEYALPLAFELAKKLRKAPRKIAEEIVNGIGPIPGFEKLEMAGAGYINARLRREELGAVSGGGRKAARRRLSAARFWLSTPASIPIRRPTSATCVMPFSATPLSGC